MEYVLKLTDHEMQVFNLCVMKAPIPREVTEQLVQSISAQINAARQQASEAEKQD